jgi:hypothetical protein
MVAARDRIEPPPPAFQGPINEPVAWDQRTRLKRWSTVKHSLVRANLLSKLLC